MRFPDSPREEYENNPIVEVVCQLRFPPILRIDAESPAIFQDKMRENYPLYQKQIASPVPPQLISILNLGNAMPVAIHHRFAAEQDWSVVLNKEFIALSTHHYEDWVEFRERLIQVVDTLVSIYSPPFFSRIGLRYRDEIKRSTLKLPDDMQWSDLLNKTIVGELGSEDFEENCFKSTLTQALYKIGDQSFVQYKHGLQTDTTTKELYYLIDSDFYREGKINIGDAYEQLDDFNRRAGSLFRWCIRDSLRDALVRREEDMRDEQSGAA